MRSSRFYSPDTPSPLRDSQWRCRRQHVHPCTIPGEVHALGCNLVSGRNLPIPTLLQQHKCISMNVMNKSHCAICTHLNSPGKADSRIHGLLLALTVPAVTKFVTERVLSIRTRNVDDGNQRSSGSFPRGHCGLSGGRRKGVLRGASLQLS